MIAAAVPPVLAGSAPVERVVGLVAEATVTTAVGGGSPACGVTASEGCEAGPGPAVFEAVTVNV